MIDSEKLSFYLGCQLDDMRMLQEGGYNGELNGAIRAFEMVLAQVRLLETIQPTQILFNPEKGIYPKAACCSAHAGGHEECKS